MPNFSSVLNDQVRRISGREINARTKSTRRLTTQHRRDIAALKRRVAALMKTVSFLERQEKRRADTLPMPKDIEGIRFRADGLRSHRKRLGLSADAYGRLVGVSGLTIYHWEAGKSRPRKQQISKIAAVRGLGKREAEKRLELVNGTATKTKRK